MSKKKKSPAQGRNRAERRAAERQPQQPVQKTGSKQKGGKSDLLRILILIMIAVLVIGFVLAPLARM